MFEGLPTVEPTVQETMRKIRRLVGRTRASCLWVLDPNYTPGTVAEAIETLRTIERHADRQTYGEAKRLRQWLSRTSSDRSASESPADGSTAVKAT